MITRKYTNLIARVLKYEGSNLLSLDAITGKDISQGMETIDNIAGYFANYLIKNNPKFNREKFLKACKGD